MTTENYNKYYVQGSDHYLIPRDELKLLLRENQELKKQVEEYKDNYNCLLKQKEQFEYIMSKQVDYQGQQKEFIKWLKDEIKSYKNRDTYIVEDIHGSYDLNDIILKLLEEILQKYKSIIGGNKDEK